MSAHARDRTGLAGRLARRDYQTRDSLFGLLLILPVLVWLGIVVLAPMISAISMSFTSLRVPGGPSEPVFLDNYLSLWGDEGFRASLVRSAGWVVANGVVQTVVALGVALTLNRRFWGQSFVRSWIVLPWVVPVAVSAILWKWMLDATAGIINGALVGSGLIDGPVVFLGQVSTALPSLIGINSWRLFPFLTLILLAALQTVPEAEYEAARVDGSTRWMQFRYITFPHLIPTMTVLGLVGTLWAANVFDLIWMITQGGPIDATTTTPLFIYEEAFASFNISRASAASVLFLFVLVAFVLVFALTAGKNLREAEEVLTVTGRNRGAKR